MSTTKTLCDILMAGGETKRENYNFKKPKPCIIKLDYDLSEAIRETLFGGGEGSSLILRLQPLGSTLASVSTLTLETELLCKVEIRHEPCLPSHLS